MNTLLTTLLSLARHGLTFGAGVLVTKGVLSSELAAEAVAAIVTLATVAWSVYEKRKALYTPAPAK